MKASPLFKRSLEESIASLEGKAPQTGATLGEAAAMPTGKPGCPQPDLPETQASTCEPSVCGGVTCGGPTCQGSYTCYNTCGTTCGSQSTCLSTCAGGVCQYHYIWKGKNWWNYNGLRGYDWNYLNSIYTGFECVNGGWTEVRFVGSNPPPNETDPYWSPNDGTFNIDKWYSNPITNYFDIQSLAQLKVICHDQSWINYASIVLHVLNPPNDYGTWHVIDFYFYD